MCTEASIGKRPNVCHQLQIKTGVFPHKRLRHEYHESEWTHPKMIAYSTNLPIQVYVTELSPYFTL